MEKFLSTAGGRITCLRCTANSSRTKKQCGRPALITSKTKVCQFHGRHDAPDLDDGFNEKNTHLAKDQPQGLFANVSNTTSNTSLMVRTGL